MGLFGNAKQFPRRLGGSFARMARNPSSCAPHPSELLEPQPLAVTSADRLLESLSARDVVTQDGLVVALSLSGRAFLSAATELFRTNPIRSLRLVAVAPFLEALARSPHLAMLARLDLSGNQIGPAGLKTLLASPFLSNLQELGLGRNGLNAEGVEVLKSFTGRERIRKLELADNGLTANDVRNVLADSSWPMLASLGLAENPIGPDIIGAFSTGPIAELGLENVGLTTLGAIRLAKSELRPSVLDLGFNRLNDAGIVALAITPLLANCTALNLRGNFIRAAGAEALLRSTSLGQIRYLDLRANPLEPETIEKLGTRFGSAVILS